ncbi:MAG: cell division protein FtsW [Clostridia bacterium]|nr:cell division protein FtsW [Clostridia bacterium]
MSKIKEKLLYLRDGYVIHGSFDFVFLCCVLLLFTIGIIMMFSAGYVYAEYNRGDATVFFTSQLEKAVIGFIAMIILSKIDYRIFNSPLTLLVNVAAIGLLFYALIANWGSGDQETSRWVYIFGIQFQPSELAKFAVILLMSYLMCIFQKQLRTPAGRKTVLTYDKDGLTRLEKTLFRHVRGQKAACFVIALCVGFYCGLILLEKHYSAAILIMLMGISILWLSGTRGRYFAIVLGLIGLVVAVVLLKPDILSGFGFAESRIMSFLDKDNPEYIDARRQTVNGLYAIGSGGLFGVGLGNSKQKQLYIAEPHNDFIFPVVVEELGFLGAAFILCLFAYMIYRGYKIAIRCKDYFGSLVVMGIMIQIALQVIINLAVVTDIIPNTGMALPFFSYGGTAIIVLLAEMGVVLSVSRNSSLEKE